MMIDLVYTAISQTLLNLYSKLPPGELPPEIQHKNERLKQLSSQAEIKIFNEHDILTYLQDHAPQWLRVYQLINPQYAAVQAHFFRYLYIYLKGGLYLNIKSGFDTCPLERLNRGVGGIGVLQTTRPIMYSKALLPRLNRPNIHLVDYQILSLYPSLYEMQELSLSEGYLKMYKKHYTMLRSFVVSASFFERIKFSWKIDVI